MTSRYSDPAWRAVEADRLMESGLTLLLLPVLVVAPQYGDGGYGDGGDGDGGGGGGYGYGDGGDPGGDGGGGGEGGGGEDGDGDGDGGGGYGYGYGYGHLTQETHMHNGLAIVTTPGGSYPYVRVGWLSHREGDVWELRNCRVIKRFGGSQSVAGLAANGPAKTTELLDSSPIELVHALHMIRVIPADEKAWAKECPKPAESEVG